MRTGLGYIQGLGCKKGYMRTGLYEDWGIWELGYMRTELHDNKQGNNRGIEDWGGVS
jgi:hypothetical protein